ncbi:MULTISPECIES: UPF0158 family protein [Gracilibacillus]|uniref:UPF0158 family protein n=1 Tax=Gracilibacillus TaxID=74385 RepID=UPI000826F446|nr:MULTISPECIES: UPF0158 family protein [Gracilibacillus]
MKIKLDVVIETIELASDEMDCYYNRETGEFILYGGYALSRAEQEDFLEELEADEEDKYVKFPTQFEIDDYDIMENFIWAMPEGDAQNKLASAIRGRGAFRRFKDEVQYLGWEQQWFDYRDKEYRQIAINWCEENDIEYWEE